MASISPGMTAGDLYHGWFYHGGALRLASTLGWGLQLLKADARRKQLREASDRLEQAWAQLASQASALPVRPQATHALRVPLFNHVFLIVGENTSARDVNPTHTPYLTGRLMPKGGHLTNYEGLHTGSLSDYIGRRPAILSALAMNVVAMLIFMTAGSAEALVVARAVETGLLQHGIMCSCVRHGVEFVLAGSIRDDGPLPDVITDAIEAQKAMREKISGVSIALMMGTMLHSMAVEKLLPATVKTICVDINADVVNKLTDRGTFQTVGLVTDIEAFLRELSDCLSNLDGATTSERRQK